jgi:hypothetical protein
MFKKNELIDAIEELEASPTTFQNCQKLATFYLLYDHLYGNSRPELPTIERVTIIDDHGDSEFLQSVAGSDAQKVFVILDELMQTVKVLQPRLYDATLTMLHDI